jgi:LysM repeat protein
MWDKPRISLSPKLKLGVGRGTIKNKILRVGTVLFLCTVVVLGINATYLLLNGKTESVANHTPQVLGAATETQATAITDIQPYKNYTVQEGDTLFNISQKINVPWTTLAELNKLKPPFSLKPGQVIKVPKND